MAYKLLNVRKSEIVLSELNNSTRDNVEFVQQGEYTICNDEELKELLNCFDSDCDYKDWRIEKLSNGLIGVLPPNTTSYNKNIFEELLKE